MYLCKDFVSVFLTLKIFSAKHLCHDLNLYDCTITMTCVLSSSLPLRSTEEECELKITLDKHEV